MTKIDEVIQDLINSIDYYYRHARNNYYDAMSAKDDGIGYLINAAVDISIAEHHHHDFVKLFSKTREGKKFLGVVKEVSYGLKEWYKKIWSMLQ
jgi:hypothetical protein